MNIRVNYWNTINKIQSPVEMKDNHAHFHVLWKYYDLKREEFRLVYNLHQRGEGLRLLEIRQDALAAHQRTIREFRRRNDRLLTLYPAPL